MSKNLGMQPRILFIESLATIAGGQRVLIDLMPALAKQFDATVLVPGEGPLAEGLRACGVSLLFAPMTSYTLVEKNWRDVFSFIVDTPRLTTTLAWHIRRQSTKLIYINNSRAFVWGTLGAWLNRRPVVWHVHSVFGDRKTRALVSLLANLATVRKIICPSDAAAAQFVRQRRKVVVVPSGVALNCFAPSAAARAAKRAELGIASDAPAIGIIGDLIPLKGQDVFIRAAAQAAPRVPNAEFLIIGEARPTAESAAFKSHLQSEIENRKSKIRWLGFQPDVSAMLNALDLLVVASTTETGPLVLLEALACGVPVLSTPVGMAPRLLTDGACGDLFPINDSAALEQRITRLMNDQEERRRMSASARQRAIESLDLKQTQARIAAIIEENIR